LKLDNNPLQDAAYSVVANILQKSADLLELGFFSSFFLQLIVENKPK